MEPWQTIPLTASAAAFLAWCGFKLACLFARSPLQEGDVVRLKTSDSVYRSRFMGIAKGKLRFAGPLQRDRHVPLSVGENISVEAPARGGAVLFRSRVIGRDPDSHEILLERPAKMSKEDRRQWKRVQHAWQAASVEGAEAVVLDLSDAGIRFLRSSPLELGDRIGVVMQGQDLPSFAWVLASEPHFAPGEPGYCIRARFEHPLSS